ncbi:helix-turn-helix domain-containing protein [Leadbettera azotonutricia]|nr:helix-turn-helix transcriptional regulator [Leadbettera azotonutricia]
MEPSREQLTYVIEQIRGVRTRKGVSQLELSLKAHLSQSFLASIETGKKQPSVLTLIKIAQALNVSPRIFFPEPKGVSREQLKDEIISLLGSL